MGPSDAFPGKSETAAGPKYLLFTLDTEPDDPQWRGLHRRDFTHENLKGLPRLVRLMAELRMKMTCLATHSVAIHPEAQAAMERSLKAGGEIGTHFHPSDTPPFGPWDAKSRDNILRVPTPLLEEKFSRLHKDLTGRFGPIRSYRSGAWALDARIVGLLEKHGYGVDSSVTPGISWRLNGRPSYLDAPVEAYYLDPLEPARAGTSQILEVPVSVWTPPQSPALPLPRLVREAFSMPLASRKGGLSALVRAVRPASPRWLRPAFKSLADLREVADLLEGRDYLHVMCHSNELWPGASPYISDPDQLDAFYLRLEGILRLALDRGYQPVTLSEYAERYATEHSRRIGVAAPLPGKNPVEAGPAAAAPPGPWRKAGVFAAKAAVSGGSLALIVANVDGEDLRGFLAKTDTLMAAVCGLILIGDLFLNASKTRYLIGGDRITTLRLFRFNLIKIFFNNILPGGLGGEAVRIVYLGRAIGSIGRSAAAITLDRISGLWMQLLFSSLCFLFFTTGAFPEIVRVSAGLGGLALAAAALPIILILTPRLSGRRLARRFVRDAYADELGKFSNFWSDLAGDRRRLMGLLAYSLAMHFSLMQMLYWATRALGGNLPFGHLSPILLLGSLSSVIPLSLGGLGVVEGAYALAFTLLGHPGELGFLVSLLMRALCLPPAIVGWFFFVREVRTLGTSGEPVVPADRGGSRQGVATPAGLSP